MSRLLSERMSLQTVAIASFVLVVVLAISLSLAVRAALDETQSLKVIQTRVLASNLTAALAFGDAAASRDVLTTLQNDRDVIWARILMPDGQVFAEYRSPDQGFRADFAAPDPAAKFRNETRLRLIQEQIIWRGNSLGQLEVWIDNRAAYDLARQVFAVALVAVLLGSLLAYVLASRLGRMVLL
ncbi:MAG: CHASE sensor domain-containing protein, partial [Luminiphilus sp.]